MTILKIKYNYPSSPVLAVSRSGTNVCIPIGIKIYLRFYTDNRGITTMQKIATSVYKGSFTLSSKRFNYLLDNNQNLQKSIAYLTFFLQNKQMANYYLFTNIRKLKGYFDAEKNNLLISSTNNNADSFIESTKSIKALEKTLINANNEHDQFLFNVIFDNQIPCHPMMKLYIFERLQIQSGCSRGLIHQFFSNHISNENNHQTIKILNQIYVENAPGPGDFNFALELSRNFEHIKFLNNNMPPQFIVQKLTLLHKNIPNSVDAQQSLLYTGQVNCDTKLHVFIDNVPRVIYMDTKQTVMADKDFTRSYLKITYQMRSFNMDDNEILQKYNKKTMIIIEKHLEDINVVNFLTEIKNIMDQSILANEFHKFILLNSDKPYGKIAVILQQNIIAEEFHNACLALIENKHVVDFNSNLFSADNKPGLMVAYDAFEKTVSAQRLYDKFKQRIILDNKKIMVNWSQHKNIPYDNNDDITL